MMKAFSLARVGKRFSILSVSRLRSRGDGDLLRTFTASIVLRAVNAGQALDAEGTSRIRKAGTVFDSVKVR
jgi:hypothetical protein